MKSQYDYINPGEVEPESLKNFEPGEYEIVANFPSRIATVSEGVQWLVSFFFQKKYADICQNTADSPHYECYYL